MKTYTLVCLCLFTGSLQAQTELGPFRFLDRSKAANFTGNLALGGPGFWGLGVSAELPPPRAMKFLDFIPGYAIKYSLVVGQGIFVQGAVMARARYQPRRKVVGILGVGLGLSIEKNNTPGINPTLVVGIDYLYNQKYVLSVTALGQGWVALGVGLHRGYGW